MSIRVRHSIKVTKPHGWVTWCGVDTTDAAWNTPLYDGHLIQHIASNAVCDPNVLCDACVLLCMIEEP